MFESVDLLAVSVVGGALLAGGTVKGVLGIGMPLVAVPVMAYVVPVPVAISLVSVPIVASNALQMFQGAGAAAAVRRFWPLMASLVIGILVGARLLASLNPERLYLALGGMLLAFVAANVVSLRHVRVGARAERVAQPVVGLIAGLAGGLSSFYGPPVIMFMVTLRLTKEVFIPSMATIYLCGSVPLYASLSVYRILGLREAALSVICLVPVFAGLIIGRRIRDRLAQDTFRHLVMGMLVVIAVDLIRRGIGP